MALSDAERARRKRAKKQAERAAYMRELETRAPKPQEPTAAPVTPEGAPVQIGPPAEVGDKPKEPGQDAKGLDPKQKESSAHRVLESSARVIAASMRSGMGLPGTAPALGDSLAQELADLWAPLVAEYIGDTAGARLMMAGAVTLAIGEQYHKELRKWADEHPNEIAEHKRKADEKAKAPTPTPKLQAVAAQ